MASETKRAADPPKGGAAKRQADIESLASSLFVEIFMAERGAKTLNSLAYDALNAAREFFKVCDQPEG